MGPSIVEWKKACCKTVCEKTTQHRGARWCWEIENSREHRGRGQRALSLLRGFVERACGGFGIRKASEGILQERKWFGEYLLGQGDRKAEVLSVCFWWLSSSVLRHLSLHRQKPEPGMRARWAPAWLCRECTETPRVEDGPRFCSPSSSLAFSRERPCPSTGSPNASEVLIYSRNPPAATQAPGPAAASGLALGLKSESSGDGPRNREREPDGRVSCLSSAQHPPRAPIGLRQRSCCMSPWVPRHCSDPGTFVPLPGTVSLMPMYLTSLDHLCLSSLSPTSFMRDLGLLCSLLSPENFKQSLTHRRGSRNIPESE